MRLGKRKAQDKSTPMGAILDELERVKARMRAKVEHPFRVIKRQFGNVKVRFRGLAKNTTQLHTLFALPNLWMMRRTLLQELRGACVCMWPEGREAGRKRPSKPEIAAI